LALTCAYLAVTAPLLVRGGHGGLGLMHLVAILIAASGVAESGNFRRVVGDLLPLVTALLLYSEIPFLVTALGSHLHDAAVQRWEYWLFHTQPSKSLAAAMPYSALSELLHAGYLAYYPAILVPPLVLLVRNERRGLAETVLALAVTCLTCWTIFAVWPVEGPRFLWGAPAGVPDGLFRRISVAILAAGSSRGAAFPSSHMAVSTAQLMMALRWQSSLVQATLGLVALLIGVGAVYAGFHYATDMIAGGVLGAVVALTVLSASQRVAEPRLS
jgi:membrane-associated phospholipid phosphatase